MAKRLCDYLDSKNWIGHFDDFGVLEFGDGTQRKFMFLLFKFFLKELSLKDFRNRVNENWQAVQTLTKEPVRHWDDTKWPGQKGIMSRDNLWPYVCCLEAGEMHEEAGELFILLLKRGFFLWNTKEIGGAKKKIPIPDWAGIGMIWNLAKTAAFSNTKIGIWLQRALSFVASAELLRIIFTFSLPLQKNYLIFGALLPLMFYELTFFLQIIFRILHGLWDRDDCSDDLNTTCRLISAQTPWTPLLVVIARELYLGFMPKAEETKGEKYSSNGLISRFQHYFAGPKNPPLDLIAARAVNKLMGVSGWTSES